MQNNEKKESQQLGRYMGNDFEIMCVGYDSTAENVIDRPAPDIFGSLLVAIQKMTRQAAPALKDGYADAIGG